MVTPSGVIAFEHNVDLTCVQVKSGSHVPRGILMASLSRFDESKERCAACQCLEELSGDAPCKFEG